MRVSLYPMLRDLSPRVSIRPAAKPFPLNADHVSMWYRGRTAIWQGVQRLGFAPGDRVLVPAYACGAEIEALLRANLDLSYYRIGPNLEPDMAHLESLCQQPARALFVTHYFGFPQPIQTIVRFAKAQGLLLIEDNSHGLYSTDEKGTPLGSFGDMSVFSFHKTIPILYGAGLILKSAPKTVGAPRRVRGPRLQSQVIWFGRMLKNDMMARFPKTGAWVKACIAKLPTRQRGGAEVGNETESVGVSPRVTEAMKMTLEEASWRMSSVSRLMIGYVDHESVVEARRRNFRLMDEGLRGRKGNRPLLRKLPIGCCPWIYPLWEEDPEGLVRFLKAEGVGAIRLWETNHPAIPLAEFPFERNLKRHVVALPVHQGLSQGMISQIAAMVNTWHARGGRPSG